MRTRVTEIETMTMKQLIVIGLIGSLLTWAAMIITLAYEAHGQTFEEWAVSTNRDEPHPCKGSKGAQAFYDCMNGLREAPDFYTLPDGRRCASKDWDGYLGTCRNPIDGEAETMTPGEAVEEDDDFVIVPSVEFKEMVTETYHPNGQPYKEHWGSCKFGLDAWKARALQAEAVLNQQKQKKVETCRAEQERLLVETDWYAANYGALHSETLLSKYSAAIKGHACDLLERE